MELEGYLLKIFTFTDGTGCTSELMLISLDADVDLDTRLLGCGTGLFFLVSSVDDEDNVTLSLGLGIGCFGGGGGGGGSLLPEISELAPLVLQANRLMYSFSGSPILIYSGPIVIGLGGVLLICSWLHNILEEYIVAHPESLECMVDVAELCLEFPSELLLLLLLEVSNMPAQISLTLIYG